MFLSFKYLANPVRRNSSISYLVVSACAFLVSHAFSKFIIKQQYFGNIQVVLVCIDLGWFCSDNMCGVLLFTEFLYWSINFDRI